MVRAQGQYAGHMRQAYQNRLNELGEQGAQMCALASEAIRDATRSLLDTDLTLAEDVIARDVRIDEMRANAEDVAMQLLALQAPVASDLRSVVSALWVVADLQRMGALAIHVAKAARRRHPQAVLPDEMRPVFDRMGSVAQHLAGKAERVLRERNVELARTLENDDDMMDDLEVQMFTRLNDADWPHGAGMAVDIALLGRFYERFADHAVAVSRRVIFLVTGENVGGDTTPSYYEALRSGL